MYSSYITGELIKCVAECGPDCITCNAGTSRKVDTVAITMSN